MAEALITRRGAIPAKRYASGVIMNATGASITIQHDLGEAPNVIIVVSDTHTGSTRTHFALYANGYGFVMSTPQYAGTEVTFTITDTTVTIPSRNASNKWEGNLTWMVGRV